MPDGSVPKSSSPPLGGNFVYKEDERKMVISTEHTDGDPKGNLAVYLYSFKKWQPPYDKEKVPPKKQEEIKVLLSLFLQNEEKVTFYFHK